MSSSQLKAIIAPSLLSCDFGKLGEESNSIIEKGADWLHCDVMDGHFVNNITIGPMIIKSIRNHVGNNAFLDCHLMISNPSKYIEEFYKSGASQLTLHIETLDKDNCHEVFKTIKDFGIRAGVSIKPKTEIDEILHLLEMKYNDSEPLIDMVLVMTVEPGFGGQSFMGDMMPKVKKLRQLYPNLDIQVDGGLSPSTIDFASEAGANVIVAGSSVFNSPDPAEVIKKLRQSVENQLNK